MSARSLLDPALCGALGEGATVVTATRRLARWLSTEYDLTRREQGHAAWRPADVLPWDAWIRRCWDAQRDAAPVGRHTRLLSAPQTRRLWRDVLDDLPPLAGTVLPGDAAGTCQRSWLLARRYELTPARIAADGGEDARRFAAAAAAYAERCRAAGWIDSGDLAARCAAVPGEALAARASGSILLAGFDRLTPSQNRLMQRLRDAGVAAVEAGTLARQAPGHAVCSPCEDPLDESLQAARWARRLLEDDPTLRLGIILTQPDADLGRMDDVLEDVLAPGRVLPGADRAGCGWNLFLERSLDEWPLAAVALRALAFVHAHLPLTEAGLLLRSPVLHGAGAESGGRARLDAWLRREGYFELDLATLTRILREPGRRGRPDCPALLAICEAASALKETVAGSRRMDEWAGHFAGLLDALGWPGRDRGSDEYQTAQRCRAALVELGSLDLLLGPVGATTALAELRRLFRDIRFQPETEPAPIQVLGLADAVGLGFDACRVTGLHDGVLPRPLSPDPLLPAGLQRRLNMPRADAAAEREQAARLFDRIAACAGQLHFSWPAREDERGLRPSPLLGGLATPPRPQRHETAEGQLAWPASIRGSGRLEHVDDRSLGAADLPSGGGTDVLRQQSDCPFRAQAVYRLRAEPLEIPRPGLDRRTSGALLHRVLEILWQRWGGQAELPAPAEAERSAHVALDGVLQRLPPGVRLGRRDLLALEQERLSRRIGDLLECDRARPRFTVDGCEVEREVRVGPLSLRLRIDRIDRSESGTLLVIDYKSGSGKIGDWLDERLAAPQLPVYALALGDEVAAIAVASLKAGEVGYIGLGGDGEFGPGILPVGNHTGASALTADWPGLTRLWRGWLTTLAEAFAAGDAAVDPRNAEACRYCHLTTLCRRHESAPGQRR